MKGKLLFLAVSACFSIMMCRFQFHFLLILTTVAFLVFLLFKNERLLFLFSSVTIFLFICIYSFTELHNKTSLKEGTYTTNGIVSSIPTSDGNKFKGYIKNSHGEKLIFYYTIKSLEEKNALNKINPGNICSFNGELVMPKSPTMPNAFDYKQYLHDHHIHWQFQVEEIEVCKAGKTDGLMFLLEIRKNGLAFIEDHFPYSSVGIVQALLFGEIRLLDHDVETAYQELGVVHLLAISGSHVALLVSGIYYIFIYCGITHEKTRIVLILLLPVYMILTGAAPSVIRATFMVILYFLVKLIKRKISSLDVISFTFLVLLLINPYYLFQVGFQLSYVVSFGLLLSFGIVEYFSSWLVKLTIVSFIAQLCAMPLLFFHFYEISLISLPMNMLFVPLYSFVILPLAIVATLITAASSTIGAHIVNLFSDMLQLTHQIVLIATAFPYTTFTTGRPHVLITIGYICSTLFLFLRFERFYSLKKLIQPAIYLLVVFIIQAQLPHINPYGKVLMLDVGQGDSIFIQRPFNKGSYLIDTGGRLAFPIEEWEKTRHPFSIAEDVTVPYFKSIGVTELDVLFLTHGDMDHIGEALRLMEEVKIKELIIPEGFVRGELEQKIVQAAKSKRIKIKTVKAGDQLSFQEFSFYVVSPQVLTDSKNGDSLVLWAELGGLKWLFTGDAEIESEEKLMKMFSSLKVDVLKVGHHGSKGSTSETLLDNAMPSIALVSAGFNNRYQHPHSEILEKLSARNIALLRTDLHGAILYNFRGNSGTFSTHPPYDEVNDKTKKELTQKLSVRH
ncbi:MAG: DNA internalization-related competence protein ComEC/Rec2 [Bacillota bacterium]